MLSITMLYAGILTLFFIVLSFNVVRNRRIARKALGDGGNEPLLRAVRVHAHFAEYVPLSLLLMLMLEWHKVSAPWLHLMGLALVVSRLLHAYGLLVAEPRSMAAGKASFAFRQAGMITQLGVLICAAIGVLWLSLTIMPQ